jgi:hypothetical protein
MKLEPIVAHDIGRFTTHAFGVQVEYVQLRAMQVGATAAIHFGSEVAGVFLAHLINYETSLGRQGGIQHLLANSLAPSARNELVHFLLKKNILPRTELRSLCQKAGYTLDALLA